MTKDLKEPSRIFIFPGSGCQINYYDCYTGAHEWMCPDFAQLCCNGWIAKWVPKNDVPEEALLFNNGKSIFVPDKRGDLVECCWNSNARVKVLIKENSYLLDQYETVESKLEDSVFEKQQLVTDKLKNKDLIRPKIGIQRGWEWDIDLLMYLHEGFPNITKDKEKNTTYTRIFLDYLSVLVREDCLTYWNHKNLVASYSSCNELTDLDEGLFKNHFKNSGEILQEIVEHFNRWKKEDTIKKKKEEKLN